MHLSFVTSSLYLSGGVQVVVEYANRLVARGHAIRVVTPRGTVDAEIKAGLSPQVVLRECRFTLKPRAGWVEQAGLTLSLAQAIPPSDIVIATHTPTILPTLLATLTRPQRRLWLYMDYPEMFAGRRVEGWLLRYGPAWFSRILTLSEAGRRDAMASGGRNVQIVGLGLTNAEWFVPRGERSERPDVPVIMYLGDSRLRKGLAEFLAAMELVRRDTQVHLLIVSKEPLSVTPTDCEIVIKPRRDKLPALYRRSDVFVFPSWGEGFGLPPLEAMACGVPVVLTDSRGVHEYARPEQNCLMVPPQNVDVLAQAIRRVLSDHTLAQALSQAGVATSAHFRWDVCVNRFEACLHSMASGSLPMRS